MTLKELYEKWWLRGNDMLSRAQAERALKELGAVIEDELAAGGEIPLPGIGKLKVKDMPARKGRNPATGEDINIPARKKVFLVMAKNLHDKLNA